MKERFARIVRSSAVVWVNGECYYSGKLTSRIGKMVLVEADVENLGQVNVYTLGGKKIICTAERVEKNAFKGEEHEKPTA